MKKILITKDQYNPLVRLIKTVPCKEVGNSVEIEIGDDLIEELRRRVSNKILITKDTFKMLKRYHRFKAASWNEVGDLIEIEISNSGFRILRSEQNVTGKSFDEIVTRVVGQTYLGMGVHEVIKEFVKELFHEKKTNKGKIEEEWIANQWANS